MVLLGFRKLQWIRQATDHQPVTTTFFGCKFGFGKCFGASSRFSHWASCHRLSYKIHFSTYDAVRLRQGSLLLCRIREDDTSKQWFFWFAVRSWGTTLSSFFHLSSLLQMLNDYRMVDIEFFGNFSCRISFNDCSQLVVVNFRWPATTLLIFKVLISFAKLLEPPMHCPFISNSWAKCIIDVASCLDCFANLSELQLKKTTWICFLSNIIS